MANLYTKTGDKGTTSLVGGSRISKADLRVECYGTVDEMGSALGFARSLSNREYVCNTIHHIQGRLFALGAEIASDSEGLKKLTHTISDEDIAYLEAVVDKCTETNGIQTSFVIPGENPPSGALHMARTVVRRCERNLIRLDAEQGVRPQLLKFVNRLSDATYALARLEETLGKQDALREKVEEEVRRRLNGGKLPFTLENIEKMAQRAREKATEMGVPVVFAAVDDGGNLIMMQRMKDKYSKLYAQHEQEVKAFTPKKSSTGIVVDGEENVLVKYSQCCNPLPGDDIVGFITRGHGVSVHKKDCENYLNAIKSGNEPERWIEVTWAENSINNSTPIYKVTLDIVASENILILAEISKTLAELHVPVSELSVRELKNGNSSIVVTINTAGVSQLNNIITRIKKLPSVIHVDRTGK